MKETEPFSHQLPDHIGNGGSPTEAVRLRLAVRDIDEMAMNQGRILVANLLVISAARQDFLDGRSITSLESLWALADRMAERRRGLWAGSGRPTWRPQVI